MTACFLINHMPSSVLQDEISIQFLHPHHLLFSLPPHTFGCVVFVHNLQPCLDKLSPKAIKRIFLGYARNRKGYKCFDHVSHKVFANVDVTLFEEQPYFSPVGEYLSSELLVPPTYIPASVFPSTLEKFAIMIVAISPPPLKVYAQHP